jgi:plant cysteine oxidase
MPVQLGRGEKLADLSPTAVADKGRASSAMKNRRQKKKAAPMQSLFDTSKEVFSASSPGFVPPPDAVARLSALLSTYASLRVNQLPSGVPLLSSCLIRMHHCT